VSVRCRGKGCIKRLFLKKTEYKTFLCNGFECFSAVVYECGKRTKKLVSKSVSEIQKHTDILLYSKNDDTDKEVFEFFWEIVFRLYKSQLKRLDVKPFKAKMLVIDNGINVFDKEKAEQLCYWISKCSIYSCNKTKTESICEYMRDSFGAFFDVCESPYNASLYDVIIDFDNLYLKIGKTVLINKFDFGFEKLEDEYGINQLGIASRLYSAGEQPCFLKIEGRTAVFNY